MSMKLYAHPFSSYCQKVLIALYENDTPFEFRMPAPGDAVTGRKWAAGDIFSLADCAAAPALFYADWAHPIGKAFSNVHAYRRRLLARPSFAGGGRGAAISSALPTRCARP